MTEADRQYAAQCHLIFTCPSCEWVADPTKLVHGCEAVAIYNDSPQHKKEPFPLADSDSGVDAECLNCGYFGCLGEWTL